jgi:hypothetical protein
VEARDQSAELHRVQGDIGFEQVDPALELDETVTDTSDEAAADGPENLGRRDTGPTSSLLEGGSLDGLGRLDGS